MDAFAITDSTPTVAPGDVESDVGGDARGDVQTNVWVVHPSGDLDAFSATSLLDHTTAGLAGRPPGVFLIDLSAVGFLDSVGLGVCTATLKRAQAAGHRAALIAPGTTIRRLLARTGIARAYPVHRSVDQALTEGAHLAAPTRACLSDHAAFGVLPPHGS
ncbi:STAS domain-containing protein [Quadrisphaera sp. INWT6]|uniref:STAS domain-containing protein n=1 Tax=Quadrisphaera sp. INWT6 TaxID=2596917 RepID=UPI0018923C8F|nr:STAS domain-containing protein [Quadrisphaera sp. INWT6]MBF5082340.1 STAS domain-containing protein [Quadrisphaera sp. INWT6]